MRTQQRGFFQVKLYLIVMSPVTCCLLRWQLEMQGQRPPSGGLLVGCVTSHGHVCTNPASGWVPGFLFIQFFSYIKKSYCIIFKTHFKSFLYYDRERINIEINYLHFPCSIPFIMSNRYLFFSSL